MDSLESQLVALHSWCHLATDSPVVIDDHFVRSSDLELLHATTKQLALVTMDLEQLFTVTDYQSTTIDIPSIDRTLSITLQSSPQASTDFDLTGQILWPVAVLLGHYLASSAGAAVLADQTVVELGAGTGLPSLVAAEFAKQIVVTDGNGDHVLDLLRRNVESKSQASRCQLSVEQLVWGDREHLKRVQDQAPQVDVVIAADVVQWPSVVEPLLHTVKALLWTSQRPHPIFLLGIVNRASQTYNLFFQLANELGFAARKVEPDEYLANGLVPTGCREFGGRETQVYQLWLQDRSSPPVLWQGESMTVGRDYQHTMTLPC